MKQKTPKKVHPTLPAQKHRLQRAATQYVMACIWLGIAIGWFVAGQPKIGLIFFVVGMVQLPLAIWLDIRESRKAKK